MTTMVAGLAEARAERDAELAAMTAAVNSGTAVPTVIVGDSVPASVASAPTPAAPVAEVKAPAAAAEAPVIEKTIDELKAELAQRNKDWQALNGRFGSETDALRRERDSLRTMIEAQNAMLKKVATKPDGEPAAAAVVDGDDSGIPAEVRERYPEMVTILEAALPGFIDKRTKEYTAKIAELEGKVGQVTASEEMAMQEREMERLSAGFLADNGGPNGKRGKPDPKWVDYLDQPVSAEVAADADVYFGHKVEGMSNRDVVALINAPPMIARIHRQFRAEKPPVASATSAELAAQQALRPTPELQAAAVRTTSASAPVAPAKPFLKMSDFETLQAQKAVSWKFGPREVARINAEYDKYMEAAIEGRLIA